jgi:peptidoglycan/LPS O-acetylase OafA/YrhL
MKYYLASPFVVAALLWLSHRAGLWPTMAMAALLMVGFATLTATASWIESPAGKTTQILAYLPSFLVGATLAFLRSDAHPPGTATFMPGLQRAAGWIALAASVAMIPSIFAAITGEPVREDRFHEAVLLSSMIWALVINACWMGNTWLVKFFTLAPLKFLGLVSFSFYLSHPIFLELSVRGIGPYSPSGAIVVALLTTLAFSWGTFRLIEKPILTAGTAKVADWLTTRRANQAG